MKPRPVALVRSGWHVRLEQLVQALSDVRQRIAEAELARATLSAELGAFEHALAQAVAPEQAKLAQILALLRTIEREQQALSMPALRWMERRHLLARTQRLRHALPASARLQLATPSRVAATGASDETRAQDVRQAFLTLARAHHPDLAQSETERSTRGRHMAHINHLYRTGQRAALLRLAEHHVAEPSAVQLDAAAHGDTDATQLLLQREQELAALLHIEATLAAEREHLVGSDTYRLMVALTTDAGAAFDFAPLVLGLRQDIAEQLAYLPKAHRHLEEDIVHISDAMPHEARAHAFCAHVHKGLTRLGLTHLASARASPEAHEDARHLVSWAAQQPTLMRLVLMTYLADLAPQPLLGLDSFEGIARRLHATGAPHHHGPTLAEALVALKDTVALGTRAPSNAAKPYVGLYFVEPNMQQAIPIALRHFEVRRLFRQVLLYLGEQRHCATCERMVFAIPLFRLRGFDNLRAQSCPYCCTQLQSYLLPKGQDIQAMLNLAYLDFDVIEEFVCHVGNTTVAMQLLCDELARTNVGDLLARLCGDVFVRLGVHVDMRYLTLATRANERLRPQLGLAQLQTRELELQLTTGSVWALDEAVEKVRFRARARFTPHLSPQAPSTSRST